MKKLMINGLSVIDICKNYLNDVKSVTDRVKAIFDVSNFGEIRKQYFPQLHIKKGDVELVFHGRGVRILEHEHKLCDIEYGMDIHICGLEEHRIFEYIKKGSTVKFTQSIPFHEVVSTAPEVVPAVFGIVSQIAYGN